MFSDIEGSTAINERLGDALWIELLHEHNAIVREHLAAHGVGAAVHYPVPIHRTEAYAGLPAPSLPVAEALAARSCSLPMHQSLSADEIGRVAAAVHEFSELRQAA
jgi:dTDP-4-amino-4,6-dideoxygalactose transaminase